MADDTKEARVARAKQIHESVKKELDKAKEEKPESSARPKTPRDAIRDEMRKLDKKR